MLVATAEVVLLTVLLLVVDGVATAGAVLFPVLLEGAADDGLGETGVEEGELGGGEAAAGGGGEGAFRLASAVADCCRVRSDDTGNASPKIKQDKTLRNICSQQKRIPSVSL